jgi:Histidine kinase-, DNA gyrase B-, and HSP90-like ATPase
MQEAIRVPARFERLLRKSALEGAIAKTLNTFSWLPTRALELFPDFTDHGPEHLSEVLAIAHELVAPRSWPHLTSDDVAVFVLSVLLHDIGMHVTTDGFTSLFQGKTAHRPVVFFDNLEWNQLWKVFRTQASRFDSKHNIELFGAPEPVQLDLGCSNWTENQRRLAGECLRRHHARLAHEIALYGFPGPEATEPLKIDSDFQELGDLAGVIARSHGTNLRNCVEYLKERYNDTIRPLNIHAVFLMGLLRLSDFLQFSPGRAPKTRLRVQSLRSLVSRREWKKHIVNVAFEGEDPESLYVYCDPQDVETFLGVRNLLQEFQTELDGTWAVLGEVYRGDQFFLSKRRVRSNLEARGWTPPQNKYVPIHARFSSNNPELLNCLVGPLYGYELAYGIRELIQNAVDAVREIKEVGHYIQSESGADIQVTLERDSLTVEDCGVGMTADTVQNYFLRAGASFRTSDVWRQEFTDRSGASKVLRSGRFGVGALASFLISDKIEVTTRHWSQASGLSFQASLFDDPIEIRPVSRPVGTTVRIPLDIVRYGILEGRCWQDDWVGVPLTPFTWYRFVWPVVRILVKRQSLPIFQEVQITKTFSHDPEKSNRAWVRDELDGMRVQWHRHQLGTTLINGIEIREAGASGASTKNCTVTDGPRRFGCWMSIWDPNGKVPIDLKRTKISDIEGDASIFTSFAKNWIAWALAIPFSLADIFDKKEDDLRWPSPFPNCFAWTDGGLILFDHELIRLLEPKRVLVMERLPSVEWPHRSVGGQLEDGKVSRTQARVYSRFVAARGN